MNEQLKALAKMAGIDFANFESTTVDIADLNAFAKLIIATCVTECEKQNPHPDEWSDMSEYTEKRIALACAKAIKDKFGIQL